MPRKDRIIELHQRLAPKAETVSRLLATADGKYLLEQLSEAFKDDPVSRDEHGRVDEHETLINVGGLRVVNYLLSLQRYHERRGA